MQKSFSFQVKKMALAVSTACLSIAASHAYAAACPAAVGGVITINTATDQTCNVPNGTQVVVTPAGSITEAATPLGIVGININSGITAGAIQNAGVINTNDAAVGMFGNINGDITNSGTLHSNAASAVELLGVLTGDVINSNLITGNLSALLLSGESGARITGNVTNTATGILGDVNTQYAILIRNGAQIGGAITNLAGGVIQGQQAAIFISSGAITGGITNSGTVSASQGNTLDINVGTGATAVNSITNTASGQIISTLADAIEVNGATIAQGISNAGTVTAKLSGLQIDNGGTITAGGIFNTGTIHGDQQAIAVIAGGIVNGDIQNEKTLTGGVAGVLLGDTTSRLNGSLINTATSTINGDQYGTILRNGVVVSGDINNAGTISGDITGILVSGATLHNIINSGNIHAQQSYALDINSFSGLTTVNAI